jgi:hypothetical protein
MQKKVVVSLFFVRRHPEQKGIPRYHMWIYSGFPGKFSEFISMGFSVTWVVVACAPPNEEWNMELFMAFLSR